MKMALIIALVCLIAGALIFGIGWGLLQNNPIDKNVFQDKVYSFCTDELPTQINIRTTNSCVEFRTTTESEWRVECMDKERVYHKVELIDGVLTIQEIDDRQWYERIGLFANLRPQRMIVYLPEGAYGLLDVCVTSGDISMPLGFAFSNVTLKSTSGDISFAADATGAVNIKVTSGGIAVSGSIGGALEISCTSGDIAVSGSIGGALEIFGTSGDIEIKNVTPTSITIQNTSGDIDMVDVVCSEACMIEKGSGSVNLKCCDALSFNIATTSGDIHASLLSAKTFDCHATSGDVHTPRDGNGGTFRAKSTSGDIRVTIVE